MRRRMFWRLAAGSAASLAAATAGYLVAPQVVRAGVNSQAARTQVRLSRPPPSPAVALTLRQAGQVALKQGSAWSADAALVSLVSRDQATAGVSSERPDAGWDGRRAVWEAILLAPSKPSLQLRVQLVGGAAVQRVAEPRSISLPPIARLPVLDSSDAVAAARSAQPALGPTTGKGNGYAFTLESGPAGRVTLTVLGSLRGMPAKVEFDAATGRPLGVSVYAFSQGGILYSADAGQSWQAGGLSGSEIQRIVAIPGRPGVAYALAMSRLGAQVSRTDDGGRTWQDEGVLPAEAGSWATDLAVVAGAGRGYTLAVGMLSGLWLSTDGGAAWVRNTSLPSGAASWPATASGVLLASLGTGDSPTRGVYASADLLHWQRLLTGTFRLSTLADGQAAVALTDGGGLTASLITGLSASPLTLSIPALRVGATVTAGQPFLAGNATEIALSLDGGRSWATTLRTNSTSIAVGPAGGGSTVVLVGGFRTGIFRSTDGGRSWRQVVQQASSIVPGSDEVGSLAFVSAKQVVAAQGGVQSWQAW